MKDQSWICFFLVLLCLVQVLDANAGDADPLYRECVDQCEKTGCVGEKCFPRCRFSPNGASIDGPWYRQEALYLRWKKWDCESDCRYYCMLDREREREALDHDPVKYNGKWPFRGIYGIQEPVSAVFSALNLVMHFHGWLSFFILLYYKLPLKQHKKVYYEYATFWHLYGLISMNFWFWSAVFHCRDVDLTERIDCYSAVALIGFSLIFAILRCFKVRNEAARVIIAAPVIGFMITHILYLTFSELDFGLNKIICVVLGVVQILLWSIWASVTNHPSCWKLWMVAVGGGLGLLLKIYHDFPPYKGLVDGHALWHASTIPLTYIWWSFIRDDAEFCTFNLLKKTR